MISLASAAAPLLDRVRRRARPPEPPPPPVLDTMRAQAFLDLAEGFEVARLADKAARGELSAAECALESARDWHEKVRDDLAVILSRDRRCSDQPTSRWTVAALGDQVREAEAAVAKLERSLVVLRTNADTAGTALEESTARLAQSLEDAEHGSRFLEEREAHAARAEARARAAHVAASAEAMEARGRRSRPRSAEDVQEGLAGTRLARAEDALALAGERLAKAESDMKTLSVLRTVFTRAVESALQHPGKD